MTSAQVVETSVNVTTNSPSQDYTHPDDHNLRTYEFTDHNNTNILSKNEPEKKGVEKIGTGCSSELLSYFIKKMMNKEN